MKSNKKVSLVVTLFNEEANTAVFLDSIKKLRRLPDEINFVDGYSTDSTYKILQLFKKDFKETKIEVLRKRGNRSVGRNEGVKNSHHEIIAFTDCGCILDKEWVDEIAKPFKDNSVEVVAGYYKGLGKNDFQKALIPYVLIMPNKINPNNFLPATRSMAILKKTFEEMGGFNINLSNNEDYAFAKKLEKNKKKIAFAKKAIIYWIPRGSFKSSFTMFYRFALGDVESKILRPKVALLFARYFIFLFIIFLSFFNQQIFWVSPVVFILYVVYVLYKNRRYNKSLSQRMYSVLIQFTADAAVLSGSLIGLIKVKRI